MCPLPLIHIGYHKTGTTFLQRRFFDDGKSGFALAVGPTRKTKVLNRNLININSFEFEPTVARRRLEPAIKAAQNRGLTPVLSYERLSGSPFAGGHDSKELADRLAAALPEARIFAVIREQTSMLLSLYKLYIRQGGAMPLRHFVSSGGGGGGCGCLAFGSIF